MQWKFEYCISRIKMEFDDIKKDIEDIKGNKKYRVGIIIVLIGIICGCFVYLYLNKNMIMQNVVIIKYADNCEERYVNDNLTSEPCVLGIENKKRKLQLAKRQWDKINLTNLNLTNLNLTI